MREIDAEIEIREERKRGIEKERDKERQRQRETLYLLIDIKPGQLSQIEGYARQTDLRPYVVEQVLL